jgi:O-methyltransferase
MVPESAFFDNLNLVQKFSEISGCVVECGVWRGGMIAAIAERMGNERTYYLFDSFEGLPDAKEIDGKKALLRQKNITSPSYFDNCSAEMSFAEEAMKLSKVRTYHIHKGWFKNTLPSFKPDQPIAILRLDGDWYEPTIECLENLYPYVAIGGGIIIDDYYTWDGCAKAVHDFLSKHKLADRVHVSRRGVCYLVKK